MKRLAVLASAVSLLLVFSCKRAEAPAGGAHGFDDGKTKAAARSAAPATGTDIGATMPEYTAMWLDGSKFDVASKRDKVVLLNIWATWCGPCRIEIPELQRLHDKYASRGFEVIGISVDESGIEPVKQFIDQQKVTYPIALDAEGKIAALFQTNFLPTSVLLDRSGKIVWKRLGLIERDDPEVLKAIEEAL